MILYKGSKKKSSKHKLKIPMVPILAFQELVQAIRTRTLPWFECLLFSITATFIVAGYGDVRLLKLVGAEFLWPRAYSFTRGLYILVVMSSGFLLWALVRGILKDRFRKRVTHTFESIGLKNALGQTPEFISDDPIDHESRRLRVKRHGLSLSRFSEAQEDIATALMAYVEDIHENRLLGTVDILYAPTSVPKSVPFPNVGTLPPWSFLVGKTRSQEKVASLLDTPHYLIAGETGGGKSTFLRGVITSLYLNNAHTQFYLIDLKGGMEFQIFENLPRVQVVDRLSVVSTTFARLKELLEARMKFLREQECQSLEELWKKEERWAKRYPRVVLVIDEAAEAFLIGAGAEPKDIQENRARASQLARLGRSVGIHLIIATQRPDSKALDPQIKANLPGVVCFPMVNDASSISVLGVGRASDLPPVPGRAIWKAGSEMIEIQTPYLKAEDAQKLLAPRRKSSAPDKSEKTTRRPAFDIPNSNNHPSLEDKR